MWNRKSANLGTLKPGQTAKATFTFDGDIELIPLEVGRGYDIETSCGCTGAHWNPNTKTMTLTYSAKDIPIHLRGVGKYNTSQYAEFPLKIGGNEGRDRLTFTATVAER